MDRLDLASEPQAGLEKEFAGLDALHSDEGPTTGKLRRAWS